MQTAAQDIQVTLEPFGIPGYVGTKSIEEIERRKKERGCISLFTGAGGFDIGLSHAGFQSRVMVEIGKAPVETLKANWHWEELKNRSGPDGTPIWKTKKQMKKDITWYHEPEPVILQRDIRTLTTKEILEAAGLKVGEVAIVFGSPPCQGFSTCNTQRTVDDPRNFLFKEFVRVVRESFPQFILLENVPGMVSSSKGRVMREVCEEFANCGYDITWNILDAAYYGVPQYRKRIMLMGKRVDAMYFPEIGNPRLHMGAMPGQITHPEWFVKRYDIKLTEQETTHNHPEQDARLDRKRGKKKNAKMSPEDILEEMQ